MSTPTQVTFTCLLCHTANTVGGEAKHVTCSGCGATGRWFRCTACHEVDTLWAEKDTAIWNFTCPRCKAPQRDKVGVRLVPWPRSLRVLATAMPVALLIGAGAAMLGLAESPHAPDLNCNGSTMGPGEVCTSTEYVNGRKVDTTTETYNQRIDAARGGHVTPTTVIVVLGGATFIGTVAGVKLWKWSGQMRRRIPE